LEIGFEATKVPSTIEKTLKENEKEKLVKKLKRSETNFLRKKSSTKLS